MIIIMSSIDGKIVKLFGMKVRVERVKRSLSQETLAELANLNRRTISTIETGESVASIETAASIARGLGMDLDKLFIFDDLV